MNKALPAPDEIDLVLSHGNCFDGFTALWCAWLRLGTHAEYRQVFHGDAPPDVTGKTVAILDFAYPRATLEAMYAAAKNMIVLDHHVSAQADLQGLPYAIFDMQRSGARIAFDYFLDEPSWPEKTISLGAAEKLVDYVQDRDLWRWNLAESKEISEALKVVPYDFDPWSAFAWRLAHFHDEVAHDGSTLLALTAQHLDLLAVHASVATLSGHPTWVANAPYIYASELGNLLCNRLDGPVMAAVWRYDHAKGRMGFSLRSAKHGPDVSQIAAALGGGGHRHAAGFEIETSDVWDVLGR